MAYAFDPERNAILLAGGNKGGAGQTRFYHDLLRIADARFERHLHELSLKNEAR